MTQKDDADYQQIFINQLDKSYPIEIRETKLNILEYCPKLEELIDIDIDGKEAGGWSFSDSEWRLKDGKTATELIRVLLANSDYLGNIINTLAIIKLNDEGDFLNQDSKTFSSEIMLTLPPVRLIRALLNSPFLSIFECLFLIGYDTKNDAISNSIHIASNAISKGIISPRDPDTNLKRNEAPAIRLNGELVIPDLSWLLTFEEAEQWAVNSFGVSFKALRDKFADGIQTADKPTMQTVNSTEQPTDTKISDDELTKNERVKYLRIIGLLAETLANTNPSDLRRKLDNTIIFGNGEAGENNKTNLLKELLDTLSGMSESPIYKLSKTTLRDTINSGIKALHDNL